MNRFFSYLTAQTKRAVRIYPIILAFTVILSVSLVLLLGTMLTEDKEDPTKEKITMGVVGDLEENGLGFGLTTITSTDASRLYIDFVTMEEDEAEAKLRSGELYGYIVIPENFIDDLNDDDAYTPLIYWSEKSPSALTPMLTKELVSIISDYVGQSQNAIYGIEKLGKDNEGVDVDMTHANLHFIDKVMERSEVYETEQLGVGNGLSFSNYYVYAFIVLLVMIWGISGSVFLIKNDMALPRLLKSSGYRLFDQVLGDYLPFFGMMLLNLLILITAASFTDIADSFAALELAMRSPLTAVHTAILLIPMVAVISAMQFFLYELCHNTISAVLTQLLSVLSLAYVSGFLYPLNSLPPMLQKLSGYLPTGVSFKYTTQMLNDDFHLSTLMALCGFFVGFMLLSAIVREYKMRSNIE